MLILGLETATRVTSVALVKDDQVLVEYAYGGPLKPSQVLMVLVDRALADAGIQRGQVEALAVSNGPGSFTGLRLGLGTAKGLAYALGIPVVGISTLEAMAGPWLPVLSPDLAVVPVLWAQRNLVYAASYAGEKTCAGSETRAGGETCAGGETRAAGEGGFPPRCVAWEALLAELAASECRMVMVGEWAWERREEIRARLGRGVEVVAPTFAFPRASVVALLGHRRLDAADGDPLALRPTYLRKSEAEERWEERHGSIV
ncbi:MAG TPA: tRNA (adenosine(37)-N6)-threonylcarbamoyltransferase complex dimerization subunit type 1 TsaB [Firmicutes bacterium]|nr:tRNA (adenosine(37)-N6)-threonylcarbamoyltransferase complex dimerization subunit type 1 TsaB [Bacillota bacterium]